MTDIAIDIAAGRGPAARAGLAASCRAAVPVPAVIIGRHLNGGL